MKSAGLFSWILVLAGLVLWSPTAAADGPYKPGEPVVFRGKVTDGQGQPVTGVAVVLNVSRNAFKVRRLSRETTDTLWIPGTTGADGVYEIAWRWDKYYNVFELKVALQVRRDGRDTYQVFYEVDLTGNVLQGSPIEFPIVLEDTRELETLRDFLASIQSEDEKRIYHEVGLPDRIDGAKADYDPDRSWWYFAAGKVYRFRGGALDLVETFEPVPLTGALP